MLRRRGSRPLGRERRLLARPSEATFESGARPAVICSTFRDFVWFRRQTSARRGQILRLPLNLLLIALGYGRSPNFPATLLIKIFTAWNVQRKG